MSEKEKSEFLFRLLKINFLALSPLLSFWFKTAPAEEELQGSIFTRRARSERNRDRKEEEKNGERRKTSWEGDEEEENNPPPPYPFVLAHPIVPPPPNPEVSPSIPPPKYPLP